MAEILIGGDVCPSGRIEHSFKKGDAESIFSDLLPVIQNADFSLVNLECPLINTYSPIEKDGAVLGANFSCIKGFKAANISAVNLSNNHILDHGEAGLRSTIAACQQEGLLFFGAGNNLTTAREPLIKEVKDKKIGFIGIAEHEFSIATSNSWGANPIDIIELRRTLKKLPQTIDHLVILVHGGKEHYQYPTPRLQKLCRFLVEEGADAVVCQHSHCAGSYEYYNDKLIVYGQGNFIFEHTGRERELWYNGFLISLEFNRESFKAKFIPFEQSNGFLGAKRLDKKGEDKFLKELEERSEALKSEGFIEEMWEKTCYAERHLLMSRVLGHNRVWRVLNRKFHFSDWLYRIKTKMMVRNVVECEVHREALETLWKIDRKIKS